MKKFTVPILTEEYKIHVAIGKKEEFKHYCRKYIGDKDFLEKNSLRGLCIYRKKTNECPLLLIDESFSYVDIVSTLAHEASHAMDYHTEYLSMDDESGEFNAHGIASVMRHCLPYITKKFIKNK
jgi:hypothetical protein|tara:strand:- start:1794 stop:2165 length:372 start_codon:yes stop_codon:yes gene_type:complete